MGGTGDGQELGQALQHRQREYVKKFHGQTFV
jgi:hypothetical protein